MTDYAVDMPDVMEAFKGKQKESSWDNVKRMLIPALLTGSITGNQEGGSFLDGFSKGILKAYLDKVETQDKERLYDQAVRYKTMQDPNSLAIYDNARKKASMMGDTDMSFDQIMAQASAEGGDISDYSSIYKIWALAQKGDPVAQAVVQKYEEDRKIKGQVFGNDSTSLTRSVLRDKDGRPLLDEHGRVVYDDKINIRSKGNKESDIGPRYQAAQGSLNKLQSGWDSGIENLKNLVTDPRVVDNIKQLNLDSVIQEKQKDDKFNQFMDSYMK